jgi:Asp-tRNA(Asn)/Glu-tRNA(Gln) amidotransferase A subunit family amidase
MRAGEIVGRGSSEEVLGARRAAGDGLGPVAGVPFAVKNLFARALDAAGAVIAPRPAM